MTVLSSGLETSDYSSPNWEKIYNSNMEKLNNTFLKLSGLLDVDVTGLEKNQILVWNSITSKWEPSSV